MKTNKTYWLLGLLILFFTTSYYDVKAQNQPNKIPTTGENVNSLRGRVMDSETGEPFLGATVYLSDLKVGTTTHNDGAYEIKNVPAGKHLVEVSFLGYKSIVETILINGHVQRDFSLVLGYIEADAIVITGVSSATSKRKTPVSVNVLKTKELNRITSTNLIDAVAKTSGVAQISTGAAISKPVIRGLGSNRVVVINDGIRQEGPSNGVMNTVLR